MATGRAGYVLYRALVLHVVEKLYGAVRATVSDLLTTLSFVTCYHSCRPSRHEVIDDNRYVHTSVQYYDSYDPVVSNCY